MRKSVDAKRTMLLHSEAKVEFYERYLKRYLRIVYLARSISEINLFDVFCGTGIYDNDKKGSPIVAFEAIKNLRNDYDFNKPINFVVNDGEAAKVKAVRALIEPRNQNHCTVTFYNLPADKMFDVVDNLVRSQSTASRNLIFIDPYGYKEIAKETLEKLLSSGRTEIILFLPISQMQRFTATAISSDERPYEPLKRFVNSFFDENHAIRKGTVPALEYISFVKDALKFDKFYATSYYIERDESNYYALFFISPHIYGFEKILEVKWQLDEESGRGFNQPDAQTSLFAKEVRESAQNDNYRRLEDILEGFLSKPRTNLEVYKKVLTSEFPPKFAAQIFRNWQNDSEREFKVVDPKSGVALRKGAFHINWESCNPAKTKESKALFILRG